MNGIFSKKGVSLERLQTLAEVIRAGSYSIAAGGDTTRATLISRQMAELEEGLGVCLFDKSKKPYQPTPAALHFAASCERFVGEVEDTAASARGALRPISVGAGELVIRQLLIPWISQQRGASASARWLMRNMTHKRIQESLASELLDVGIADGIQASGNVQVVELQSYGYQLVLPAGLEPDDRGWQRLSEVPVVLLDGMGCLRQFLLDYQQKHGVSLLIGAECTSYPQAVDLAEAAGYAVFVPEYWWRRQSDWRSRTQPLPGLEALRRILKLGWNRNITARRSEVAALVKALGGATVQSYF